MGPPTTRSGGSRFGRKGRTLGEAPPRTPPAMATAHAENASEVSSDAIGRPPTRSTTPVSRVPTGQKQAGGRLRLLAAPAEPPVSPGPAGRSGQAQQQAPSRTSGRLRQRGPHQALSADDLGKWKDAACWWRSRRRCEGVVILPACPLRSPHHRPSPAGSTPYGQPGDADRPVATSITGTPKLDQLEAPVLILSYQGSG